MKTKLTELKKSVIIIDIETAAKYPNGDKISIQTHFEDYVEYARCKWFGAYSYLHDEYVEVLVAGNEQLIQDYIAQHDIIVGFNNEEFDYPILYNNNLIPRKRFLQVDCLITLGSATFFRHDGLPFKNRGGLMGYKFKKNSLKHMAEIMKLDSQKGDIDYNIFFQDVYTELETEEIKKYLRSDVEVTKQMFDALWDYWMPFTEFLDEANALKLTWIKSSIASLTYQCACNVMVVEPTYADKSEAPVEEMGGRVIDPKYEEAWNVWYVDFASLYPHIIAMFNLLSEKEVYAPSKVSSTQNEPYWFVDNATTTDEKYWHGNDMFKVKGYYNISKQHILGLDIAKKLKTRFDLKKSDPDNPMIYTLKIFLNSFYGAMRSIIFEKIHTENSGWDCCWIGQQIHEYVEKRLKDFGFETVGGFTDSLFIVLKHPEYNQTGLSVKEYLQSCLNDIVKEILANVPFPCDTFNIEIEKFMDYIMYPFDDQPIQDVNGNNLKNEKGRLIKERRGKRNNYLYISNGKVKLVGMPVMKDNATLLGQKIFEEKLKPLILEKTFAKFDKEIVNGFVSHYLSDITNVKLLAREFKVKPGNSYKPNKDGTPSTNIYAQISRGYFNGQDGVISLIKNKKIGNAGKTALYCSIEEAIENKLTVKDLDLTKLRNELEPFVKEEM